jgi:hypothetical protein
VHHARRRPHPAGPCPPIDQLPGERYLWADLLEQLFGQDEDKARSLAERVLRQEGGDRFPDILFGQIVELRAGQGVLHYDKEEDASGALGPRFPLSLTAVPSPEQSQVAVEIGIAPGERRRQQVFACVRGELSFGLDKTPPYCEVALPRLAPWATRCRPSGASGTDSQCSDCQGP